MTPFARSIYVCAIITCFTIPAWAGEYLLYTPQPLPADQKADSHEGILVQEIEIQKGDTLFDLSRKFSGHGMYFPQILLFNNIKNPDLIYSGHTLKVPLNQKMANVSEPGLTTKPVKKNKKKLTVKSPPRDSAADLPTLAPTTELSASDLKSLSSGTGKNSSRSLKKKHTFKKKKPLSAVFSSPPADSSLSRKLVKGPEPADAAAASGLQLFETAVKAYRKDDCHTALELFDRYLADNSNTPLASDASLYRAECYLKLSAQ